MHAWNNLWTSCAIYICIQFWHVDADTLCKAYFDGPQVHDGRMHAPSGPALPFNNGAQVQTPHVIPGNFQQWKIVDNRGRWCLYP